LGMCEGRTPQIQLSKSVPVADDDAALIAEEEANNPNNNKKKKKKKVKAKIIDYHLTPNKKNQYTEESNIKKIPYLLMTSQQKQLDWAHNCILIPKGLKSTHSFTFPMKHTGYLKGNDKIKWLTTFVNFDLSFLEMPIEYKNLFRLMSSLVSAIIAPYVSDSDIADLFLRTVEALGFWEAMLPESEQYFAVHEILDIVDGLRNFGPTRGWWTLSGERFMSLLKKHSPVGGLNCVKVLVEKFTVYEQSVKYHYDFNKPEHLDSLNRFNDNMIKLEGSHKLIQHDCWNDYVRTVFFDFLFTYLSTEVVDDLLFTSSFYRLYMTHKQLPPDLRKEHPTFYDWIKHVNWCYKNDRFNWLKSNSTCEIVNDKYFDMYVFDNASDRTELGLRNCVQNSYHDHPDGDITSKSRKFFIRPRILYEDAKLLHDIVFFQPIIYKRATIKGLNFHGRGPEYSEIKPPIQLGIYKDKKNRLILPQNFHNIQFEKTWSNREQKHQWGKAYIYKPHQNEVRKELHYVQFNVFFRLINFNDVHLNNHPFANVTARTYNFNSSKIPYVRMKVTTQEELMHLEKELARNRSSSSFSIKTIHNFVPTVSFVGLRYVVSTNVGVVGSIKVSPLVEKPILTECDKFTMEELNEAMNYTTVEKDKIDFLYLIDMQTERSKVDVSLFDATIPEKHYGRCCCCCDDERDL